MDDYLQVDRRDYTPLHIAAEMSSVAKADLLLRAKASVNAHTRHKKTPLHRCLQISCSAAVVRVLLDANADVNARDRFGETPLYFAALRTDIEVAQLLVDNNADVDFKGSASAPLHHAATHREYWVCC